jgi:hypothetical protein
MLHSKALKLAGALALILVITGAGRLSLAHGAQAPASAIEVPKPGSPPQGIVLSGPAAVELASMFYSASPPRSRGVWRPTTSDIARLEKALPDFMRRQKHLPADYHPLHEYFRQYVGIVRDGKKTIGINFAHFSFLKAMVNLDLQLHKGKAEDWRQRPIVVDDGGAAFFHLQFDPATGLFSALLFNGVA